MASKNTALNAAAKAKQDEFYTQLSDIEKEMRYYRKHFKSKTVFCNCDDPFESNFFKFFVLNFNKLGLKKLICTCYAGSPIANQQLSLFDVIELGEENKPYKAIITTVYDKTGDGMLDMEDIKELFRSGENELTELEGDGDFSSPECLALMDEADIVVTNPPFSLFRKYMATLISRKKSFIIIGNQNAAHYKEIFPLLREGKVWLGYNHVKEFIIPDGTIKKFGNVLWYTNLDIKKRHEEMILVKKYCSEDYPKYINYDAIDVNKVANIPYDYPGKMGVPDGFLETYNPSQFEIIGLAESSLGQEIGFSSNLTEEECAALFKENKSFRRGNPIYRGIDGKLHKPFARIIIRNKHPEINKEK
ncbi:adenine-specific methyltransferase EcoRI family protein [Anaerovibrio sp. RM50]|uniref:adenine-specific methyltransferase EcoRI family protein n=1 Tax=Anaerovibrio sp. RM50 TaxID=1200557 RepID=UPI00047FCE69|nr:adenine-specific methyltransferase EcoRI family protein [Anaerovibrio sp. RM50]